MAKKGVTLISLFILTIASWFAQNQYMYRGLDKLFSSFLGITILYFIFSILFGTLVGRKISDDKTRYTFRKSVFIVEIIAFLILIAQVWVENAQTLVVAYGLGAAGVAIALQDILKNFVGGIVLFVNSLYRVGDRVQLGDSFGDVIDIGLLYTTLLETGGWTGADQATGRIAQVPNGFILGNHVENYTKDHPYLWEELTIPLTYGSDWEKAIERFTDIVVSETKELTEKSESDIDKMARKYYLPKKPAEPKIFMSLTDNWVELGIRYITDAKKRRAMRDRLSKKLLEEVEKSDDLRIASESLDVNLLD